MIKKIKDELNNYETQVTELNGSSFSAHKLVRRIMLFKTQTYPTGKLDSQGKYKYWFDIITPRRDAEIKNIDFDTKDIVIASDITEDAVKVLIANARLRSFLKESGQAAKLNEAVERSVEWGNVVWKKAKGGYQLKSLDKFFVLNQTAESLEDSDVIEYETMSSSDLRKRIGIWENVDELLKAAKTEDKEIASEFHVYERNGEISEKDFNEIKGLTGGDENKFLLTKVIVGGIKKGEPTTVLFSSTLTEKEYKEYHRGTYCGRWLRVGMYELLFDIQTRANEIGNQIARGLEWASKTVFRSANKLTAENIISDLLNGDIVKSADLQQVETRMQGLDQLIADWNRLMELADSLANSYEVVTGENSPSGTPFKLAEQQNFNANKLFDFIREKLAIAFQEVVDDWIIPDLLKDLRAKDTLKLTSDSGILERYYEMVIDYWYVKNLIALPPHSEEEAAALKKAKMSELLRNKEIVVQLEKEMWDDFRPRAIVSIVGENYALQSELQTLQTFIALEQDMTRRTALIELAMKKKNIDVDKLPKTPLQPVQAGGQQLTQAQYT